MAPSRNGRVDYLRVYPGLNDFSDALEAIPQTVVGHLTHLKEVNAESGSGTTEISDQIKSYFKQRNPETLRKISTALDALLPSVGQKMHIGSLAAEHVSHQLDRLNTDYKMICEHEIPQTVQVDENDPAFIEIVPQEKQASLRSQARREAREAREARRANQQESRSNTPSQLPEPQVQLVSRRRGRTTTPQQAVYTSNSETPQPADAANDVTSIYPQCAPHEPSPRLSNSRGQHEPENELRVKQDQQTYDTATAQHDHKGNVIPPVVMPIAEKNGNAAAHVVQKPSSSSSEDGGAEAIIGLKRKRGSAPKSSEPVYCYCQRGSFGEMVGCDGPHCEREWFHLECIGLSALPKGQWFCEECRAKLRRR